MTDELTIPEKPEVGTYEKTTDDDGTEIRLTFKAVVHMGSATINWTAKWDDTEKTGYTDELNRKHGAIMYRGSPRINGQKTPGSKLPDETLDALEADLEAMEEYVEAKAEANRKQRLRDDLTFTIKEVSWEFGHRTKYTRTARVLVPSKSEEYRRDDETGVMPALKQILGEANGKPLAEAQDEDEDEHNPFEAIETGTEFTVEELYGLVDGLETAVADVKDNRERQHARAELRDEHPELRGVRFNPQTVTEAFERAASTGESVVVAKGGDHCDSSVEECSWDRLTYSATPDGDIEISRTHTY